MRFLVWVVRFVVIALLINFLVRLFLPRARGAHSSSGSRTSSRRVERLGGALVRDPQCGTYVPQSKAIAVGAGSSAVYFCSPGCRDAWQAAHGQSMAG